MCVILLTLVFLFFLCDQESFSLVYMVVVHWFHFHWCIIFHPFLLTLFLGGVWGWCQWHFVCLQIILGHWIYILSSLSDDKLFSKVDLHQFICTPTRRWWHLLPHTRITFELIFQFRSSGYDSNLWFCLHLLDHLDGPHFQYVCGHLWLHCSKLMFLSSSSLPTSATLVCVTLSYRLYPFSL